MSGVCWHWIKKSIRHHMFLYMSVGGFRLWQRFLRIFICRIFLRERSTVVMQRRFVCGFLFPFGWFRNFCIRFHLKICPPEVKARLSVYQIWNSFGFRYCASYIGYVNQLGMKHFFANIPLLNRMFGENAFSTFQLQMQASVRHWESCFYMEGRRTGCGACFC